MSGITNATATAPEAAVPAGPAAVQAPTPQAGDLSRVPFTVDDEKDIRVLSTWMAAAGVVLILSGVLETIHYLSSYHPFSLLGWICKIVVGAWVLQSALSLRRVITTAGADQRAMVAGIGRLG